MLPSLGSRLADSSNLFTLDSNNKDCFSTVWKSSTTESNLDTACIMPVIFGNNSMKKSPRSHISAILCRLFYQEILAWNIHHPIAATILKFRLRLKIGFEE
jgi:hypothetical protein